MVSLGLAPLITANLYWGASGWSANYTRGIWVFQTPYFAIVQHRELNQYQATAFFSDQVAPS
jgi:hypothetical protein